ncbi:MAG: hypothetical protein WBE38_05070, partial [Terracidiphilus sp.]
MDDRARRANEPVKRLPATVDRLASPRRAVFGRYAKSGALCRDKKAANPVQAAALFRCDRNYSDAMERLGTSRRRAEKLLWREASGVGKLQT